MWIEICKFVLDDNSNVSLILYCLWDIHSQNIYDLDLSNGPRSNVICQSKGHMRLLLCWQSKYLPYLSSSARQSCMDLTIFWVYYSQRESLALKMKIKDVDNMDDNWLATLLCQQICMLKLDLLSSAVCSQYILWTYIRMDVHTAL